MYEFIVWFPNQKRFMRKEEASINLMDLTNGRIVCNTDELENSSQDDKLDYYLNGSYTIHNYIGKTDINGKKIYADSSIVEFEKSVCVFSDFTGEKEPRYQVDKYKAYFYFNDSTLRYNLKILTNSDNNVSWAFKNGQHGNFKIIDTIQENKLGLIKCTT